MKPVVTAVLTASLGHFPLGEEFKITDRPVGALESIALHAFLEGDSAEVDGSLSVTTTATSIVLEPTVEVSQWGEIQLPSVTEGLSSVVAGILGVVVGSEPETASAKIRFQLLAEEPALAVAEPEKTEEQS